MLCLRLLWLRQFRPHSRNTHRVVQVQVTELSFGSCSLGRELSEHTYTVELERSHVVDLHLQILELTVVVLRVGGVLHHAFAQSLQLDHPVEDFARRSQNSVLDFEKGSGVLDASFGAPPSRTIELSSFMETARPPASSTGWTIRLPLDSLVRLFCRAD